MNDLFIQGLTIDWNRVRPYNYVRQIPAISGIDKPDMPAASLQRVLLLKKRQRHV